MKRFIITILLILTLTGCYKIDTKSENYIELGKSFGVYINPVVPIFTFGDVGFGVLKDERIFGQWIIGEETLGSLTIGSDNKLFFDGEHIGNWNYVTHNVIAAFFEDNYVLIRVDLVDEEGTMAVISISTANGDYIFYGVKFIGASL